MHVGDRGVGRARPLEPSKVAGDESDDRAAVVGGQEAEPGPGDRLVAGRGQLEGGREVEPELDRVERPTVAVGPFAGQLVVKDAATGGHPLGVAFGDHTTAAVGVVIGDLAVEDVAARLDAAVRIPRRAFRFAGYVDQGPDVIEQRERVGIGEGEVAGEGSGDHEAGSLGSRRAVTTLATGRGVEVWSGWGRRGRTRVSSTVTAGMAVSSSRVLVR